MQEEQQRQQLEEHLRSGNKIFTLVAVAAAPLIPRNGYFQTRTLIPDYMPAVVGMQQPHRAQPAGTRRQRRDAGGDEESQSHPELDRGSAAALERAAVTTTTMQVAGASQPMVLVSGDHTTFYYTHQSRTLDLQLSTRRAFRMQLQPVPPPSSNGAAAPPPPPPPPSCVLEDQLARFMLMEETQSSFGGGVRRGQDAFAAAGYERAQRPACLFNPNSCMSVLDADLDPSIFYCRAVAEPCGFVIADADWLRFQDNADDILCSCIAGTPVVTGNNTNSGNGNNSISDGTGGINNPANRLGFFGSRYAQPQRQSATTAPELLALAVARWGLYRNLRGAEDALEEPASLPLLRSIFGNQLHLAGTDVRAQQQHQLPKRWAAGTNLLANGDESAEEDAEEADDDRDDEPPVVNVAPARRGPGRPRKQNAQPQPDQKPQQKPAAKRGRRVAREESSSSSSSSADDDDDEQWPVDHATRIFCCVTSDKAPNKVCFIPAEDVHRVTVQQIEALLEQASLLERSRLQQVQKSAPAAAKSSTKFSFVKRAPPQQQQQQAPALTEAQLDEHIALVARRLFACRRLLRLLAKELDGVAAELVRRRLVVGAEIVRYETHARFRTDEQHARRGKALWGWYLAAGVSPRLPTVIFRAAARVRCDEARLFRDFADPTTAAAAAAAASAAVPLTTEKDVLAPSSQLWPILSRLWGLPACYLQQEDPAAAINALNEFLARDAGANGAVAAAKNRADGSLPLDTSTVAGALSSPYLRDAEGSILKFLMSTKRMQRTLTPAELGEMAGY